MTAETEALKTEVKQAILALQVISQAGYVVSSFGDGYKQIGINFSLLACEIAAKIIGADLFFAKMLNHKFRMDAADLMFERALAEAA